MAPKKYWNLYDPHDISDPVPAKKPVDVPEGNFLMTDPEKGWFCMLRFYFLEKSFFDKSWRPSEVEEVQF